MSNQAPIKITTVTAQPSYKPTEEQTRRAAARRRFNRLYIYTPVLLLTAVALVIFGIMVWSLFTPVGSENAAFLSGLADIILILVLVPQIFIWGAIVAVPIALYIKRNRDRKQPVPADQKYVRQYGRFRLLLWQIDHKLSQLQQLLADRVLPAVVNPIIRVHRLGAALKTWVAIWYDTLFQPDNQTR
jgi:hypothetical protein